MIRSMKISSPEILFVCSFLLFLNQLNFLGGIFLSLGVIGATVRASIESHYENKKMSHKKDIMNVTVSILNSLFASLSTIASNRFDQEDGLRDVDEEDYN
jgi:hypothetical protein